jgi:hypothetical protein
MAIATSAGLSPEDLLRQAESAMSLARQDGGGRFALYGEGTSRTS